MGMGVGEPPWRMCRRREAATALAVTGAAAAATTLESETSSGGERGIVTRPLNGLKILNRAEIFGRFIIILGRAEMSEFLWNSVDSGRIPEPFL